MTRILILLTLCLCCCSDVAIPGKTKLHPVVVSSSGMFVELLQEWHISKNKKIPAYMLFLWFLKVMSSRPYTIYNIL